MVDGEVREWTKSCNRYVDSVIDAFKNFVVDELVQELIGECYEDLWRGEDVLASEGLED